MSKINKFKKNNLMLKKIKITEINQMIIIIQITKTK